MTMAHKRGDGHLECSATPDEMPLARKRDRFDAKPSGSARSMASEIDNNALGPSCHLDSAQRAGRSGGHLGTGSDSLAGAAGSIASGARAAKANFGHLARRNRT